MQGTIADVPYEVWRNITSFLTAQEVKNLYSVSRPLFSIAMEKHYRCAYIGSLGDEKTIHSFQRLVYKVPAQYVRELHMCPVPLGRLLVASRRKKWWDTLSNIPKVGKADSFTKKHISAQPDAALTILAILANLCSVTKYHLQYNPINYSALNFEPALPYISTAWSSFGSNLRHLQLSVAMETIPGITGTITLDSLEELILNISLTRHNTDRTSITHLALLEFINNHCEKLKLFALNTLQHVDKLHFALQKIAPMPLLENFSFSEAYDDLEKADLGGLHNFLQLNSRRLKKLDLQFHSPHSIFSADYRWFSQPCFQVLFLCLKSLTIKILKLSPEVVGGIVECVHQYSDTLTSLDLKTGNFSLADVEKLVNGLARKSNFQRLAFFAHALSPKLLLLLSHNLTYLEDLSIVYNAVECSELGHDVPWRWQSFREQMAIGAFPDYWELRNLSLTSQGSDTLARMDKRAVARAFPKVVTFNGMSRERFLS